MNLISTALYKVISEKCVAKTQVHAGAGCRRKVVAQLSAPAACTTLPHPLPPRQLAESLGETAHSLCKQERNTWPYPCYSVPHSSWNLNTDLIAAVPKSSAIKGLKTSLLLLDWSCQSCILIGKMKTAFMFNLQKWVLKHSKRYSTSEMWSRTDVFTPTLKLTFPKIIFEKNTFWKKGGRWGSAVLVLMGQNQMQAQAGPTGRNRPAGPRSPRIARRCQPFPFSLSGFESTFWEAAHSNCSNVTQSE